jgi:hypothetical protein
MTLEDYNTEMMNLEMNGYGASGATAGGNTVAGGIIDADRFSDAEVYAQNAQNAQNVDDDFAAKVNAALNELDGQYAEVPPGTYIVDIQNISYGFTMKGVPKVTTKMKITDGEYAGRTMYFTNVLSSPVGVAILIRNLRKLATDLVIEYNSDVEFQNLVGVLGEIVATNNIPTWYRVRKSVNSRGFSSFEIMGVVDELL